MSGLRYFVLVLGIWILGMGLHHAHAQRVPLLPDLMVTQTGDSIPCLLARQLRNNLHIYYYNRNASLRLHTIPKEEIRFFQKRYYPMRFGAQELLVREFEAGMLDTSHRNDLAGTGEGVLTARFGLGVGSLSQGVLDLNSNDTRTGLPGNISRLTTGLALSGGVRVMARSIGFGIAYQGHVSVDVNGRIASHYLAPEMCVPIRVPGLFQLIPSIGAGMIYHTETEHLIPARDAHGSSTSFGGHFGLTGQALPGQAVSPYIDFSYMIGRSDLIATPPAIGAGNVTYINRLDRLSLTVGLVVRVGR